MTDAFWRRALELAGTLDATSYYALLDVGADAPADVVRAAYARRIAEFHPDRHARERDPDRRRALVSIQARINEAYRVLSSGDRRAAYDRALASGELRLGGRPTAAPRPETPRTPRGRLYFDAGKEREAAGDLAGARLQYGLAIQVEPESAAIRDALARVSPAPPPAPAPAAPPPSDFVREDTRHPYPKPVRIQCKSWEHLVTLHARNLSRGGIFVKTASPLEVGTHVEVQLGLPDGRSLALEAEVARVVAPERGESREPPGMALRFLAIDADRQRAFEAALADAAAHAEGSVARAAPAPARASSSDPVEEAVLREVRADVARMREASRHEILGVAATASAAELRAAYAQLARRYHPDLYVRYRSELVVDAAIDAFTLVQQAYERLVTAATPAAAAPRTAARTLLTERLSASDAAAVGQAALAAGRHAEARQLLAQAMCADDGAKVRAAYHLAAGYEARAAGRHAEADEQFRRALAHDKTCEEAIRALRRPEAP